MSMERRRHRTPRRARRRLLTSQRRTRSPSRVRATSAIGGTRVNDDASLEREADQLGAEAARGPSRAGPLHGIPPERPPAPSAGESPAQLKSTFKPSPTPTQKDTPLETLHKAFEKYHTAAKVGETYNFHRFSTPVAPNGYKATWGLADTVTAEIDPSSKRDSKNRDNGVIGPYGHFGAMERSIFGRQSLGNTYDGGHLVEHTLMEGQDADVEGNLAPQDAKYFNQSLMRGWEAVAESLKESGTAFTYTVKVSYDGNAYTRTGAQLVDAKVFNPALLPKLPANGPNSKEALENEAVQFVRWIPSTWTASIDVGNGNTIPSHIYNKGEHYRNLAVDLATARSAVYDDTIKALSTGPSLVRQRSNTLGGYIETASAVEFGGVVDNTKLRIGGQQRITATMFQPQPQDLADQDTSTTNPKGVAPAVLPSRKVVVSTLTEDVSLPQMLTELQQVKREAKPKPHQKKRKLEAPSTIDQEAKRLSPEYKKIRTLLDNNDQSAAFIAVFANVNGPVTGADWAKLVQQMGLPAPIANTLMNLESDPKFKRI
ncbi:Hypothetical protein A7982_08125 [Minicystis rosea]|nr:Hypothetical protein A7982_08125 [Minicystis rosea]